MVRHWGSLVTERSGGDISDANATHPASRMIRARDNGRQSMEEGNTRLKMKAAFFYVKDGMVASTAQVWLQTAFDMPTGLFDQVEMKKNAQKTVGVICHPCRATGVWSDEAYTRCMAGAGEGYK